MSWVSNLFTLLTIWRKKYYLDCDKPAAIEKLSALVHFTDIPLVKLPCLTILQGNKKTL